MTKFLMAVPPRIERSDTSHVDTFVIDHTPPEYALPDVVYPPGLSFPERMNCADSLIAAGLDDDRSARPAIVSDLGGVEWTYQELDRIVSQIAHVLTADLGLVSGNRVLVRGVNSPLLGAIWLGVVRAGGVVVMTSPLLRATELENITAKARITHVLCAHDLVDDMAAAVGRRTEHFRGDIVLFDDPSPASLDTLMESKRSTFDSIATMSTDPCLIAFTSGTTGGPKATVHSHRDVMAVCGSFARHVLKASATDRFIGSPSLAFTYGLGGSLLFPLYAGATTILSNWSSPVTLSRAIRQNRATVCFSGPTGYRMMTAGAAHDDFASLRCCVSAGEPLSSGTRKLWKDATGIDLVDGLGSTEMLHIFASMPGEEARVHPGAIGRAVAGYELAIHDDEGRALPAGELGRLAVKGPTGCRYLADERQREYVQNGWNITGDACRLDTNGYLYYEGRLDDIIVSAGYNISPVEVENVLLTRSDVRECAVVGVPDEQRGQLVKAFVVLAGGYEPTSARAKELQDFTKSVIAPYKYPRLIEFRSELPKAHTGKVQRFQLRAAPLHNVEGG